MQSVERVARGACVSGVAVLAVLQFALPSQLRAQDPDSVVVDTIPRYTLGGLTVDVVRPISTIGGSSAVELSLDSAAPRPAPSLEQVLRAMPLVQIRTNSRGQAQPALRGSEDRQIAVIMDGVPLTLGWDHRTDLSMVPLSSARSVTLVRGLSSVLHGPNVLGGVVQVDVARGAAPDVEPERVTLTTSVDHVGDRGLGVTGGDLIRVGGGSVVLRGGLGYRERPGVAVPDDLASEEDQDAELVSDDGGLRLNSDLERYDGFFSARYRAASGAWASLSTSAMTSERGVPPEAHVEEPRLWRYPRENRLIAALTAGTGFHETPWGRGDAEISLGLDAGRTSIDSYDSPEYRDVVGGETGDGRTATVRLLADHSLGGSADLKTAFTYADVTHDEVLDEVEFNEYRQRLWSMGVEVDGSLSGLFGLPGLAATRVSAGFVVDGADTPESGDKPPLGRLWDWGARLGFSSLVEGGSVLIHGSLSRRTRVPALRELYSGALGRFEPNPALRPEALAGGEIGATVTRPAGELQIVAFHQRLTDGIVRTSVEGPDGESRFKRVNRDEIRSTGLELFASGGLGPTRVSGDLTLQKVRAVLDSGEELRVEYEPTATGRVGLAVPLAGATEASIETRFRSSQFCENPEAGGLESFETDPQVDLSLRRIFRVGAGRLSRIDAVASVDNVTDAAVFDQCGLPQPGRTLSVRLRLW